MSTANSPRPATILLLIVLATAALNINVLDNQFVDWDDPALVTENYRVKVSSVREALRAFDPSDALEGRVMSYYPLREFIYACVHAAWGLDPAPYHLVQVLFHIVVVLLVYLVASRWTSAGPALLAAALFAAHPIHTESVAWVAALKDPLFTMFLLLAVALYQQWVLGKRWRRTAYAGSIVCLGLSLLSKPIGAVLPLLLLGADLTFGPRRPWRAILIDKIPYLVPSAATFLMAVYVGQKIGGIAEPPGGSPWTTFMTMTWVCFQYVGKIILPLEMSARYVVQPVGAPWSPRFLIAAIVLCALVVVAVVLRRRAGILLFVLLWFTISLAPVLNIIPIQIQMADRYLYLPSVGVCIGAAAGIAVLWRRGTTHRAIIAVGLAAILLAWTGQTLTRNDVWQDSIRLWTDVVHKSPEFYIGHSNLAQALIREGRTEEAESHLRTALALQPSHTTSHLNLSELLRRTGRFDEGRQELLTALRMRPDYAKGHNNLGTFALEEGDLAQARASFERAIELDPTYPAAHLNLGRACMAIGDRSCVLTHIARAIALDPAHRDQMREAIALLLEARAFHEIVSVEPVLRQFHAQDTLLWTQWAIASDAESGRTSHAFPITRPEPTTPP